ncbi:MAG: hypothetical protein KGQ54_00185 [Verrucomicrobia bacterium]|nr:hypothetical protein [Verrucomicrobiota bacterium]
MVVSRFLCKSFCVVLLGFISVLFCCKSNSAALTEDDMRAAIGLANTPHLKANLRVHVHDYTKGGHMRIDPKTLAAPGHGKSYFNTTDISSISQHIEYALAQALIVPRPPHVTLTQDPDLLPAWNGVVKIECTLPQVIGFGSNGIFTNKLRIFVRGARGPTPYFASAFPVS